MRPGALKRSLGAFIMEEIRETPTPLLDNILYLGDLM